MKYIVDLLLGKTCGQDRIRAIHKFEKENKVLTPKERFEIIVALEWTINKVPKFNWGQTNFENFRKGHLHWLETKSVNYSSIYIHTGTFPGL